MTAAALLFPIWVGTMGSLALFLSALRRPRAGQRRTPFLALAIFSFAGALIGVGWVVPAANQQFRVNVFAMHGGHRELPRGFGEMTLPELIARANSAAPREYQVQVTNRLGLAALCPVLVLLASQLQQKRRVYRWVLAPALLIGLGFLLKGAARSDLLDESDLLWSFLFVCLAAAIAVGCVRNQHTTQRS